MDESQTDLSQNLNAVPPAEEPKTESIPQAEIVIEDTSPLELQLGLEEEQLIIVLPTTNRRVIEDWDAVWLMLERHLEQHEDFPVLNVNILAQNQLLGGRQLQQLAELLSRHQLQLKRVRTNRRQTAIAAATAGYAVEQESLAKLLADIPNKLEPVKAIGDGTNALYLSQTVRSGTEIRH
ncbi:MAG: septum site-determining protein MinC, partial [Limnothrix sp.]